MSKQNKKYDNIDEIIKMAFEAEKADTIPVLTDEDLEKEGIPLPPADMLDKIKSEYAQKKTKPSRIKLRIALVAAAILILIAGAIGIYGIKGNLFNLTSNISENAIEFLGGNVGSYTATAEEKDAYTYAEDFLGTTILKPTYLPDGYFFDSMNRYADNRIMLIYKNGKHEIRLTQRLKRDNISNGENIDIKSGEHYTITDHNTTVIIGEHLHSETSPVWLDAIWSDEKLSYQITANCTKDELEKFILGLE